jgi:peptidase M48-like protein
MSSTVPTAASPSGWGVDRAPYPLAHRLALVLPGALGALLVGAIVALAVSWQVALLAATVTLGLSFVIEAAAGAWVVRKSGAKEVPTERVSNIASGLASRLAVQTPRILVLESATPNALVVGARGASTVIITRSMLDEFTRTELEAVLAHCLVRVAEGRLRYAVTSARLGRWAARFAPRVGVADDVHAAALTRYPPALASAISKSDPHVDDRFGPLWFVWNGTSHVPSERRAAALLGL